MNSLINNDYFLRENLFILRFLSKRFLGIPLKGKIKIELFECSRKLVSFFVKISRYLGHRLAAFNGYTELLGKGPWEYTCLTSAILNNKITSFEYLLLRKCPIPNRLCNSELVLSRPWVLEYLIDCKKYFNKNDYLHSISDRYIEATKVLFFKKILSSFEIFRFAVINNQLYTVKFIVPHIPKYERDVYNIVHGYHRPEIFDYLKIKGLIDKRIEDDIIPILWNHDFLM